MENKKIIVSLTTIPSRLNLLIPVINSIINQTIRPDEIVLVLPQKSFREQKDDINDPYEFTVAIHRYLTENNITLLRPEKDYGPIMKILPVILREKERKTDNIVISIDDDKVYFNNTIEDLVNCYKRTKSVCARKGSVLLFQTNDINNLTRQHVLEKPLRSADFNENDKQINFIYGTGGVLYCPSFFNDNILEEVEKIEKVHKEALFVDDVLLSVFLMKTNIKMYIAKTEKNDFQKRFDNVKCGVMDPSTISQNINRLALINSANGGHNNVSTVFYFKNEIFEYAKKQNITL